MAVASFLLFLLATACLAIQMCSVDLPGATANLSTVWNTTSSEYGDILGSVLLRSVPGYNSLAFAAGFSCSGFSSFSCGDTSSCCDSILFGVYIICIGNNSCASQFVWSANRDHLVEGDATLNFTASGDLLMQDTHGSIVWSTNTSGQSVVGMKITDSGNLVLFDQNNAWVWQSFDHPTDCLLPGQKLLEGMRLTPNISATNWSTSNLVYLTVRADGLYAFAESSTPQTYYRYYIYIENSTQKVHPYASLINGSLAIFVSSSPTEPNGNISLPPAVSLQFLRFESDAHLRLYEYQKGWWSVGWWSVVEDAFKLDACEYPNVCGEYGVCSMGQCFCPTSNDTGTTYFRRIDNQRPDHGCTPVTPLSCQSLQQHQLVGIPNVSYFNYMYPSASLHIDEESCKLACLRNCSCRAAIFHYFDGFNSSCSLLTQVFSLEADQKSTSRAYLKVQMTLPSPSGKHRVLLGSMVAGVISLLIIIIFASLIALRNPCRKKDEDDELGDLSEMPMRFTFETLKVATKNFTDKLGQGGFGSVFMGQLDDERVAVKFLDRADQGKKGFLAEVQTIGNLHHVNLVRLIGFCAEKSQRLLVYEYMSRGSLDRWIYYRANIVPLEWHTRHKVITDIANGLSYLHEECRRRIAHLDIKPQNILLDDNFNAKISDFGLSKLIDRDESRVMTRMRGTPGYLAPEWLTSQITEKVDVYSFGVVVMEIISGRKNIDYSQPENSIHLITLLQEKAKNNLLEDMIDRNSDDMLLHKEEVIETMKLATWCLQSDSDRRPSMSVVVKVMKGERDVETNLGHNFFDLSPALSVRDGQSNFSSPPVVSVLSAPR